jgi:hypothetical protein
VSTRGYSWASRAELPVWSRCPGQLDALEDLREHLPRYGPRYRPVPWLSASLRWTRRCCISIGSPTGLAPAMCAIVRSWLLRCVHTCTQRKNELTFIFSIAACRPRPMRGKRGSCVIKRIRASVLYCHPITIYVTSESVPQDHHEGRTTNSPCHDVCNRTSQKGLSSAEPDGLFVTKHKGS